jgi:ATP-dependent helicase/nuclease subunit A
LSPGDVPVDRRADDRAARYAAQTVFGVPVVLEAGAGTGKTTVLVARVLAWCLGLGWEAAERVLSGADGVAPAMRAVAERVLERVVAITFTEAAAAEMETRIMRALAQVAGGEPVLGYEAAVDATGAAAHRSRARALLAVFDRLHMQTIHAFCRRLLASYPLEAGLHPRFSVDARGTARNAAAREALEERLRAMAEHGDADLEELLLHGAGAPELEEMLIALLAAAVPVRDFAADPLAPERVDAFVAQLRDASSALAAAIGERFAALGERSIAKAITAATVATSAQLAAGIASREDLSARLREIANAWSKSAVDRLREWGRGAWETKSERAAALGVVEHVEAAARTLHPLISHARTLDVELLALVHRALAPLLESAARRLHEVGAESFDALLRKTRDLLVERPEIAERVREDIDQLLVDEFQDTDSLQCEIVATLALGGEVGARPGLFLVGDPKQSIYGWRNADIGAYMSFVDRVLNEPGAVPHRLYVNYRSVPAVLDEVARIVEPAMRFEHGVQPAFQKLLACEENVGVAGSGRQELAAIEYWVSATWDADARALAPKTQAQSATKLEAKHLARELLRIRETHGVAWKDVALLFRSTGDLDEYLGALRNAEIPYTVDRDRFYYRRREVLEAAALVRTVLDPSDQIAQVAVLRAAWVGVPDVAWRTLWAMEFPDALRHALEGRAASQGRLREIVAAAALRSAGLDVPGLDLLAGWEANLLHALDVLIALRHSWLEESVDRFIEKLRVLPLLEATEAARYPGAFRLANLGRFFRELAASLETGDAATVLRALRRDAVGAPESYEGRPQDAAEDAVQVMTIHGAKGLDFEHVYVLQLHKTSAKRVAEGFVQGMVEDRLEWCIGGGKRTAVATLGFDAVRARRDGVEVAELLRTLYVAVTRAKSRLVLAGCFDADRPDTHAGFVLDVRAEALRDAATRVGAALEAGSGTAGITDVEGARVVFLGAVQADATDAPEAVAVVAVATAPVQQHASRLRAVRPVAELRQRRTFGGRASGNVADADRELRVGGGDAEREEGARAASRDALPLEMEVAAAVGTAIHGLLERFDWDADEAAEWARQRDWLLESLARRVAPSRLELARSRATRLLQGLAAGPLWTRLRELRPHILAREFPVLVRADANGGGAIGYVVGAVDLVYRDPACGEVVVVDFKTDRVATAAAIATRSLHHHPQAELYRRAIHETLRLPQAPRVELWFLDASHVEILEFEPAPGEARGSVASFGES